MALWLPTSLFILESGPRLDGGVYANSSDKKKNIYGDSVDEVGHDGGDGGDDFGTNLRGGSHGVLGRTDPGAFICGCRLKRKY